jgi:hypothetical protein
VTEKVFCIRSQSTFHSMPNLPCYINLASMDVRSKVCAMSFSERESVSVWNLLPCHGVDMSVVLSRRWILIGFSLVRTLFLKSIRRENVLMWKRMLGCRMHEFVWKASAPSQLFLTWNLLSSCHHHCMKRSKGSK